MSVTSIVAEPAPVPEKLQTGKYWALALAVAVLVAIASLPPQAGLPVAGQRMLAVFGFAVVVWVTEAVDYAISAIVISALMAMLLGMSPDPAKPQAVLGTVQGLTMAVTGFGNTALILVAAALFLAAAMTITGLDRRIALRILSLVGARTRNVVIGNILVAFVLSFLIPSATARAAAMIPIMLGVVAAFGADRRSRFAALLMITTAQGISIWNVGVKTAAAQNMIALGYIQKMLGHDITWVDWLVAAAPFSIALSIALYAVMTMMLPPEADSVPGGAMTVRTALADLGPISGAEKRLLTISLILAAFGLDQLGGLAILAVLAAFLIIIHLGFASATALAAAMIPIVIAVLQKVQTPGISIIGMTMVLQFVISFGFVVPVNSPQGMVAYGTETFSARDFVRTGLVLTVLAYLLTLLFGATYWRWLGYV
jgi:di/tricarboxylate transporter